MVKKSWMRCMYINADQMLKDTSCCAKILCVTVYIIHFNLWQMVLRAWGQEICKCKYIDNLTIDFERNYLWQRNHKLSFLLQSTLYFNAIFFESGFVHGFLIKEEKDWGLWSSDVMLMFLAEYENDLAKLCLVVEESELKQAYWLDWYVPDAAQRPSLTGLIGHVTLHMSILLSSKVGRAVSCLGKVPMSRVITGSLSWWWMMSEVWLYADQEKSSM